MLARGNHTTFSRSKQTTACNLYCLCRTPSRSFYVSIFDFSRSLYFLASSLLGLVFVRYHSLTSRPSSMRVGDSRRQLRCLSSPLCSIYLTIITSVFFRNMKRQMELRVENFSVHNAMKPAVIQCNFCNTCGTSFPHLVCYPGIVLWLKHDSSASQHGGTSLCDHVHFIIDVHLIGCVS